MTLVFGKESDNLAYPLRVDSRGHVYVRTEEWFTGSAKLHTDADGDLYVRPADWFSGSATLHTDADGDLYVRPADWFSDSATLRTDTAGTLYIRPSNWLSNSFTLRTDSEGTLYTRPAYWFSNSSVLRTEANGDLYVRPSSWFTGSSQLQTDSAGKLYIGAHGWFGGAWRKDPLRIGYSGRVLVRTENTNLPAGSSDVDSNLVPTGEVWIITQIGVVVVSATMTQVTVYAHNGSIFVLLFRAQPPTTGVLYDRQGYWVLMQGDRLRVSVVGATAGDDVFLMYNGFIFNNNQ